MSKIILGHKYTVKIDPDNSNDEWDVIIIKDSCRDTLLVIDTWSAEIILEYDSLEECEEFLCIIENLGHI